jgi:hypothetical protein
VRQADPFAEYVPTEKDQFGTFMIQVQLVLELSEIARWASRSCL